MAEWQQVASSHIEALAYDEDSGVLSVRFTDGSEYEYDDVSSSLYEAFLAYPSKGHFFKQNVRGAYEHRRVR